MTLQELLVAGVAQVKSVVASLRVDVTHTPFGGYGVAGPTAGTPVTRTCLHERKERQIRQQDGTVATQIGTLTFLDTVTVTVNDRFTLPDGTEAICLVVLSPPGACITEVALGTASFT